MWLSDNHVIKRQRGKQRERKEDEVTSRLTDSEREKARNKIGQQT